MERFWGVIDFIIGYGILWLGVQYKEKWVNGASFILFLLMCTVGTAIILNSFA